MKQNKGGRAAILLILVGGVGVGALAFYVKSTPAAAKVPQELRRAETAQRPPQATFVPPTDEVEKPPKALTTKPVEADAVHLPVFGDEISEMALAKEATPVPKGGDAMRFVASKVAEAAHLDGARVLGIQIRDHVAIVSYNAALQKGLGSMQEGAFFHALQVGFGQFTDVDKITVEADGEPLQSGHFDLSQPLSVIRPGERSSGESDSTHGEP